MSNLTKQTPGSPPNKALVQALRRLLRPLVRLLLHFQITFPFLAELIKSIYVEVAEKDFALEGKKQTDSRLSVLTGIHRKDIKRLKKALVEGESEPEIVNLGTSVVSQWVSDERFIDEEGKPKPLALKPVSANPNADADNSSSDSENNFEALVQSVYRQDVGARSLLDEWLRLGIVSIESDHAVLNMDAFIPKAGSEEQAFFLGMNLADHIGAIEHNIMHANDPFFERCVYYENLTEEDLDQLKAMVAEEGMATLKKINKKAQQLKKKHGGKGSHRFNSGLYLFHEAVPPGNKDKNESGDQ